MKIPKRFSLRVFLIAITAVAVLIGLRCAERNQLAQHRDSIQRIGGKVFYTWQQPSVQLATLELPPAPTPVIIGGKTKLHQGASRRVPIEVVAVQSNEPPPFGVLDFIFGNNEDLTIALVILPSDQVNADMLQRLQQPNLTNIMCVPLGGTHTDADDRLRQALPKVRVSTGRESDLNG